jgi:hypothetical protein
MSQVGQPRRIAALHLRREPVGAADCAQFAHQRVPVGVAVVEQHGEALLLAVEVLHVDLADALAEDRHPVLGEGEAHQVRDGCSIVVAFGGNGAHDRLCTSRPRCNQPRSKERRT